MCGLISNVIHGHNKPNNTWEDSFQFIQTITDCLIQCAVIPELKCIHL